MKEGKQREQEKRKDGKREEKKRKSGHTVLNSKAKRKRSNQGGRVTLRARYRERSLENTVFLETHKTRDTVAKLCDDIAAPIRAIDR